jgi:hypothetical protein
MHVLYCVDRIGITIFGTLTYKKVILKLPKVLESCDPGVMEWWSIGVLKKQDVIPIAITPTLHYSNTPELVELKDS